MCAKKTIDKERVGNGGFVRNGGKGAAVRCVLLIALVISFGLFQQFFPSEMIDADHIDAVLDAGLYNNSALQVISR